MTSKETEKFFDSINMDELTDVSSAFVKALARFGTDIPKFDVKCPKGRKCSECGGKGWFVGAYRGKRGQELVCKEICNPRHELNGLYVPVWMWRIRKLTETKAWKLWSLEGCFDSKYYKTVEEGEDLRNEILLAETKFGRGSTMTVGGNMIFVKDAFWEAHKKKRQKKSKPSKESGLTKNRT